MTAKDNWDEFYLKLAHQISEKSKDRSTKVGAVIVGPANEVRSIGYNGFPRGVDDAAEHRHERPAKYYFAEHGERNAIYNAARVGIPTEGCTIYVTSKPYRLACCADCARAIIQSGIKRVVHEPLPPPEESTVWAESMKATFEMFKEAGIQLDEVKLG
jgi:dCMP deaminase